MHEKEFSMHFLFKNRLEIGIFSVFYLKTSVYTHFFSWLNFKFNRKTILRDYIHQVYYMSIPSCIITNIRFYNTPEVKPFFSPIYHASYILKLFTLSKTFYFQTKDLNPFYKEIGDYLKIFISRFYVIIS